VVRISKTRKYSTVLLWEANMPPPLLVLQAERVEITAAIRIASNMPDPPDIGFIAPPRKENIEKQAARHAPGPFPRLVLCWSVDDCGRATRTKAD
jgi:hypothetical protein